jgi:phytoene dehydrogenase-like protein
VIEKLVAFIKEHQGTINTATEITVVDPVKKHLTDTQGNSYQYQKLVWAADLKTLYRLVDLSNVPDNQVRKAITERQAMVADKTGNDSVFTLFLGVNLDKEYFASKASEHFFYTPNRSGESLAGPLPIGESKETIKKWLEKFFALTTYEITCPVMRDETLAPEGKTGLIVSVLFDYPLTRYIREMGWYEEFKSFAQSCILKTLDASIYPGINDAIIHKFSSSPLTMERYTGNTDGAITGWSFTNHPMPAEYRLPKIFSATDTPIPGVFQAGQWTYSPSGLPISILTGKLASDRVIKELSKRR